MKNKAALIITLFFGLVFIQYLIPFVLVEAAKLESGATIKKSPPLEVTCMDKNGDGVDDNTGRVCGSTSGQLGETACGLQIVSGVPIKYGALNPDQISTEQKVVIKDVGVDGTVKIKGSYWISDTEGNPTISGPEITHIGYAGGLEYNQKNVLTNSGLASSINGFGALTPFYFQFKVPINGTIGSIHQDITIDLLC